MSFIKFENILFYKISLARLFIVDFIPVLELVGFVCLWRCWIQNAFKPTGLVLSILTYYGYFISVYRHHRNHNYLKSLFRILKKSNSRVEIFS